MPPYTLTFTGSMPLQQFNSVLGPMTTMAFKVDEIPGRNSFPLAKIYLPVDPTANRAITNVRCNGKQATGAFEAKDNENGEN